MRYHKFIDVTQNIESQPVSYFNKKRWHKGGLFGKDAMGQNILKKYIFLYLQNGFSVLYSKHVFNDDYSCHHQAIPGRTAFGKLKLPKYLPTILSQGIILQSLTKRYVLVMC